MGTFQSKVESSVDEKTEDLFLDWIRDFPIEEKNDNSKIDTTQSVENVPNEDESEDQDEDENEYAKRKVMHDVYKTYLNVHSFSRVPNGKSPRNGKTKRYSQFKPEFTIERISGEGSTILTPYGVDDCRLYKGKNKWKIIELLEKNCTKKVSLFKDNVEYYLPSCSENEVIYMVHINAPTYSVSCSQWSKKNSNRMKFLAEKWHGRNRKIFPKYLRKQSINDQLDSNC